MNYKKWLLPHWREGDTFFSMPAKKYNECIKYKLLSLTNGFHNQLNQLICKSVQPTCSIHSSSVVTLAGLIPIILQIHCISPTSGHHFLLTHYFQHPLLLYSFTTGLKLTCFINPSQDCIHRLRLNLLWQADLFSTLFH